MHQMCNMRVPHAPSVQCASHALQCYLPDYQKNHACQENVILCNVGFLELYMGFHDIQMAVNTIGR